MSKADDEAAEELLHDDAWRRYQVATNEYENLLAERADWQQEVDCATKRLRVLLAEINSCAAYLDPGYRYDGSELEEK
jgi:hypothetical protein